MSFNDKLLLASQSPRRRDLVRNLFKNIELIAPNTDEPRPRTGDLYIKYLTHCVNIKWADAQRFVPTGTGEAFMLVADTIVVLKNQILGKPQTLAEATKMLKSLSGREHKVSTAFILARPDQIKPQVDIVETLVSFHVLSPGQIKSYVASREPMDKAGAYGFQGAALKFIRSVKGPYSNIVGLPLEALRARALALGARESAADDHG